MSRQKTKNKISIEDIEEMAIRREDTTRFFSGNPIIHPGFGKLERVHKDIQRVNVDALDRYYVASRARKAK